MKIGPYSFPNNIALAPMAGVSDRPFRQLCRAFGAGMTVSEMVSANPALWTTRKSMTRVDVRGEPEPRIVQLAGTDPNQLAQAARHNVEQGADIIDINLGCPAKKVCNKLAGSALLRDEGLVARIFAAVVAAVDGPVTAKIRTGWDRDSNNAVTIARIAEQEGIQSLVVHGRSRACAYRGHAEHASTAAVKAAVAIPVIANGDIDSVEEAARVMQETGADGVMIGRAAQGRPWIFEMIARYLHDGQRMPEPGPDTRYRIIAGHLRALHEFYGEVMGVRFARKHMSWYCRDLPGGARLRGLFNQQQNGGRQLAVLEEFFATPERQEMAA